MNRTVYSLHPTEGRACEGCGEVATVRCTIPEGEEPARSTYTNPHGEKTNVARYTRDLCKPCHEAT